MVKTHNHQLEAVLKRNEETEVAFQRFQKVYEEKLKITESGDKEELTRRLNHANAENSVLLEKLQLSEKFQNMLERENQELRSNLAKPRPSIFSTKMPTVSLTYNLQA